MNFKEAIKDYIYQNLIMQDEDICISDDDNIFTNGYVNSLFAMMLITFIENKFNITVTPDDININNFNTINHINEFICSKKKD